MYSKSLERPCLISIKCDRCADSKSHCFKTSLDDNSSKNCRNCLLNNVKCSLFDPELHNGRGRPRKYLTDEARRLGKNTKHIESLNRAGGSGAVRRYQRERKVRDSKLDGSTLRYSTVFLGESCTIHRGTHFTSLHISIQDVPSKDKHDIGETSAARPGEPSDFQRS